MKRIPWIIVLTLLILSSPLFSMPITSPKTGDTWYTGYDQTITWNSQKDPFDRVKIFLISAETSETVHSWDIGEDRGSYRWNISRSFHPGTYKIRIRIGTEYAESGPFEIKESFIRVTYPKEMIRVVGPTKVRVTWESSDEMDRVRITKIHNGQETGSDVIENLNYYDFHIDTLMRGAWRLKIANGNKFNHFDYSETILISQASLKMKSPSSPKSYRIGETIGISWESENFDKSVRVELWDPNEERLLGIIKDETDEERYSWDTFSLGGMPLDYDFADAGRIKVVALNVPDLFARSSLITIQGPLVDDVMSLYRPNQGYRFVMGKTGPIEWTVSDDRFADEEMDIHLYRDETLLTTIGKAKLKDRRISWDVPHGLAEGSQYRLKMELPRFQTSTLSKYFIIHGDYCFSNKVKVSTVTLDKEDYLFNEEIEMRFVMENPSADPIHGTMRLYTKKDRDDLGRSLGDVEIEMSPGERREFGPVVFKPDMLFNGPGKYSRIFEPKIIPKNLGFLTCNCIGKPFVVDASRQIPCGIELIDFTVDKAKYYENENLEYSFTMYNRSEHPFEGDVAVTGSSGFGDAEFYRANKIKLGQGQKKEISGSVPIKDIVDEEGRYQLKLKGEFFSSDAIVESGKVEIRKGPRIEVLPQWEAHDMKRVDLAIERCRFIEKSEFKSGDKGKVYLSLRNKGNVELTVYRIRAWSVVGSPQKTTGLTAKRFQERGRVSFDKTYKKIIQRGKTTFETLEIPILERKSGTFTLYVEASSLTPKGEANPKDNRKTLPYKFNLVLQIKK